MKGTGFIVLGHCFGTGGSGFRIYDLGLGIQDSRFEATSLGLMVCGLGLGFGVGVWGPGLAALSLGLRHVRATGCGAESVSSSSPDPPPPFDSPPRCLVFGVQG